MKKFSALIFFSITLLFSSGSMAQSSDFWAGEWELTLSDPDTEEFLNTAFLTIYLEDDHLVGTVVYAFQDGTELEFVIEHFNDSDTELIIGIKDKESDELYFPLTLNIEDDETLSGTWEEYNSENTFYNVIAKKIVSDR